jgi:hypothetical protein
MTKQGISSLFLGARGAGSEMRAEKKLITLGLPEQLRVELLLVNLALLVERVSNSHRENNALSALRELVERFKLLVGVSSLGVATAILALSNRGRTRSQSTDPSLGLILMALAGALSFFLTGFRSKDGSERRQRQVRTG